MLIEKYRLEVADYGRKMLHYGLTMGTGGNISARDPLTGLIAIKPSGIDYDKLTAEDITVIDLDGRVVEGAYKASSEWPMHTFMYRHNNKIGAVMHTHAPFISAFCCANKDIPIVTQDLAEFASGWVRVAPFQLPGCVELGSGCVDYLGDSDLVLLQNHGSLAIGPSLYSAYAATVALERACATYYYSLAMGQVTVVSPEANRAIRLSGVA